MPGPPGAGVRAHVAPAGGKPRWARGRQGRREGARPAGPARGPEFRVQGPERGAKQPGDSARARPCARPPRCPPCPHPGLTWLSWRRPGGAGPRGAGRAASRSTCASSAGRGPALLDSVSCPLSWWPQEGGQRGAPAGAPTGSREAAGPPDTRAASLRAGPRTEEARLGQGPRLPPGSGPGLCQAAPAPPPNPPRAILVVAPALQPGQLPLLLLVPPLQLRQLHAQLHLLRVQPVDGGLQGAHLGGRARGCEPPAPRGPRAAR